MKKIVIFLMTVVLSTCVAFAATDQFFSIGTIGGYAYSSAEDGNSIVICSYGATGWETDDYNFEMTFGFGSSGASGSLSYSRFLDNGLFASIDLGFTTNLLSCNAGLNFGVSFVGVGDVILNLGARLMVDYIIYDDSDSSSLLGTLKMVVEDIIPINDSLSMNVGLTVGSIPLFCKSFDGQTGESHTIKITSIDTVLRTSIKYSYPMEPGTVHVRKK